MQEFQLVISDQGSNSINNYKKYDILFAPKQIDSKKKWDQMLERGLCSEKDYIKAQVYQGVFKYPWSKNSKKISLIIVSNDNFTDSEIDLYNSADVDEVGNLIKRRKYEIDFSLVEYEGAGSVMKKLSTITLASINDKSILVEPRYDKSISKSFITLK